MPGISIISNFDVNQSVPIDSRLVATSSTERNAIQYKYAGLKVYQVDVNRTFTWNGASWDVEGSGIYGGSGSLVSDTVVDFGTVSVPFTDRSEELTYVSTNPSISLPTKNYLVNGFYRHTNEPTSEFRGVEYRHQLKYLNVAGSVVDSAYIAFNPKRGGNDTQHGGIAFHTGYSSNVLSEKMRITYSGKVGIGTTDPKEFLQIATNSDATSAPLVFHNAGSAVIGHNWYFSSGTDQFFDISKASTKIVQSSGSFIVQNRPANTAANNYINTLFTVGTNGGRVGVRNISPTTALDVTGEILGLTVSSANRMQARSYNFNAFANSTNLPSPTSIFTSQFNVLSLQPALTIRVAGTPSFTSDGNFNYIRPRTLFYDKVDVSKDLYVVQTTTIEGNLTVTGTSSITNFEPYITLTPSNPIKFGDNSVNGLDYTGSIPLTSFGGNISFRAYRVGALTHIDFFFRINGSTNITQNNFRGFLFKFSNERFKPADYGFGSGYMHITPGGNLAMQVSIPLSVDVFQSDSDLILSTGTTTIPTVTGDEFYIRVRTHNFGSGLGSEIGLAINNFEIFKGSITYRSADITSVVTPTTPSFPSIPGESISTIGGGPVVL